MSESTDRPSGGRSPSPALWILVGMAATLVVVVAVELVDDEPRPAPEATAAPTAEPGPDPLISARSHFAELYLGYLLETYYVRSRGFCLPLLEKICASLASAELLQGRSACETLPNARFVLAVGRYQNRVGLPVDGKAGPETVRMLLGGDFASRRGMAAAHCPGWSPPGEAVVDAPP